MNSASADENAAANAAVPPPVIIDLGKVSRKQAKQLKKGKGLYLTEVQPAIAEATAKLGDRAAGKEIVPVVVLYRKKPNKLKFPGLNLLS